MIAMARRAGAVALLVASCLSLLAVTAKAADDFASLAANKRVLLDAFAPVIASCVVRRDTTHHAFHGCIDWHSAAHGTWALVAIMRATGDDRYTATIREILTPGTILAETELLMKRPTFEMPYGRAWLLRLAIDHRRYYGTGELDDMALKVAVSLERWLTEEQPGLLAGEYGAQAGRTST
jgi:hypothetical protein